MQLLAADPANPEYIDALKGLIYHHGYVPQDREAALNRLARYDLDELKYIILYLRQKNEPVPISILRS